MMTICKESNDLKQHIDVWILVINVQQEPQQAGYAKLNMVKISHRSSYSKFTLVKVI